MQLEHTFTGRVSLHDARPAAETREHLLSRIHGFPEFVHKWTKRRIRYRLEDLSLPSSVHFRGNRPNWKHTIAIGGTRSPSVETFCLATEIVSLLSNAGMTIISGGVPGVDLAAHLAAVDVRGTTTLAVLANPVESGFRGHEWSNDLLEQAILNTGGFISEYDLLLPVDCHEFRERLLARDRIISGLCDVFVAFECSVNSATVDTARRAVVQGKKVICVESRNTTGRIGLKQLVEEDKVPVFSAASHSVPAIVSDILARLPAVLSAEEPIKTDLESLSQT